MSKKSCNRSTGQNFGYSSRIPYDDRSYKDKVFESTGPLQYRVNENYNYNCDACTSTFGPRSGYMGHGVSMPIKNKPAVSQAEELVDIDSILSNRNVLKGRDRSSHFNHVDVTKFKLEHPRLCNNYLNYKSSRLSHPAATYREMAIDRFYNLNKNPQENIFYDFAENTSLTAKDDWFIDVPKLWSNTAGIPHEVKTKPKCKNAKQCPVVDE